MQTIAAIGSRLVSIPYLGCTWRRARPDEPMAAALANLNEARGRSVASQDAGEWQPVR